MKLAFPTICTAYVHSVEEQAEEKAQLKAVVLALNKQKPRTKKGMYSFNHFTIPKLIDTVILHCYDLTIIFTPKNCNIRIKFVYRHKWNF